MSKLACHTVRVVGRGVAIARISMPEGVVRPMGDASNLAHTLDLAAITPWSNAAGHAGIRPEPFGEVCQYRDKSPSGSLAFCRGNINLAANKVYFIPVQPMDFAGS